MNGVTAVRCFAAGLGVVVLMSATDALSQDRDSVQHDGAGFARIGELKIPVVPERLNRLQEDWKRGECATFVECRRLCERERVLAVWVTRPPGRNDS
jgi:hypothetical protein